jgi:hypothetical protein
MRQLYSLSRNERPVMPMMMLKLMQCLKNVKFWTIMTVKISVIVPIKILGDSMTAETTYYAVILLSTQL